MAKDLIHDAVKNALIKDGWTIVADPFRLDYKNFILRADIAAERRLPDGAVALRVVVEVKSFAANSFVRELQQAIGQYMMYLDAITLNQLPYQLWLSVSDEAYRTSFQQSGAAFAVQQYGLKLLVVDVEQEEIVQWIE